jgi:hypothetical protein
MVQSDDISLSVDVQRRVKDWEEVFGTGEFRSGI